MKKVLSLVTFSLLIILLLNGCSKKEKTIVIASKPMSEQFVISEMLVQLIEANTDFKVERKFGIGGGTANIHPAMVKGEIDIYPEYTGTGWEYVLKNGSAAGVENLLDKLNAQYIKDFQIQWLALYGFNNTYALAIKKDKAEKLGIKTYSDLATKSSELTFGAEYDFYEREDGFKGLSETYGFNFKNKKELDIGLKYKAISADEVDVINAFSTDGLLKENDLVILQDDKNFFPSYHATTLIRKSLADENPKLVEILNSLEGKISDEEMSNMNFQIDSLHEDPKDVAKKFLVSKGLLK